jgi:hypothetical protein
MGLRTTASSAALLALVLGTSAVAEDPKDGPGKAVTDVLTLVRSIALPGVEGRIDHLALDAAGETLVVAALGNGSVEVIDLGKGAVARRLEHLREPQGVAFLPKSGRLAVACGEDGTVRWFEATTFAPAGTLSLGADADNTRVDAATGRLYVGYGDGGVAVIEKGELAGKVPLSAHPEAFALETKGPRIFVNVPNSGHVAVVDRVQGKATATWDVRPLAGNFPMALDEEHHRLFVGCRSPTRLLVLDTGDGGPSGKPGGAVVATLEIAGDVDDVFYDAGSKRLFVSCGAGAVDVLGQTDADHYRPLAHVATAAGARTSLLTPDGKKLFVAVPHRGSQRAEVREYAVGP